MANFDFAAVFARNTDVQDALWAAVSRSRVDGGVIDPTSIVKELIARHPDLTVPPAALLEDVMQAVLEAAMSIQVRLLLPPEAEAT
jgi:hypothetical protein